MAVHMEPFIGTVEVFQTSNRGRGVRCTSDVKKGTTLMRDECFVFAVDNDKLAYHCDYCLESGGLKRCAGCKVIYYCSKSCQEKAWNDHRKMCKCLQRYSSDIHSIPIIKVRLLAKLVLHKRVKQGPALDDKNFPLTVRQLSGDGDKIMTHRKQSSLLQVKMLMDFLGKRLHGFSPDDLLKLLAVLETNCLRVFQDESVTLMGEALYLKASMVNHHCVPNCACVNNGRFIELRSIQDLKKGEEVFFSYYDQLATTRYRRDRLQRVFFFNCTCSKCENPQSDLVLRCYTCPSQNCQGFLTKHSESKATCSTCGQTTSNRDALWKRIQREEKKAEELAEFAENNFDAEWSVLLAKHKEALELKCLHPNHYLIVTARENAMLANYAVGNTKEAIKCGRENMEPLRYQYRPYHMSLLALFLKMAIFYTEQGNYQDAIEMYKQVQNIISVSHDSKHPLHAHIKKKMDLCKKRLKRR